MQTLVFSLLVACAFSAPSAPGRFFYSHPGGFAYPYNGPYNPASPVQKSGGYVGPFASQFHFQDGSGRASFGYAYPEQAAVNYRDSSGNQVGSYAYINPNGKEVDVSYSAGTGGFRVLSNDLPIAPEQVKDSPEVVAAKAEFFKHFNKETVHARKSRDTSGKAEPDYPVKVNVVGKSNEVKTILADKQFFDDLKWKSVDLNEDGFPDVDAVPIEKKPAPVPAPVPVVKSPSPVPFVAPYPVVAPGSFYFEKSPSRFIGQPLETVVAKINPLYKTPSDTYKFDPKKASYQVASLDSPDLYFPYPTPFNYGSATPKKQEASRQKRQVVYPTSNLYRDFVYNSVDLNRDGRPDNAIYTSPYAYSRYYPYYSTGYSFYNRFY